MSQEYNLNKISGQKEKCRVAWNRSPVKRICGDQFTFTTSSVFSQTLKKLVSQIDDKITKSLTEYLKVAPVLYPWFFSMATGH